jgi:hypothetical protein
MLLNVSERLVLISILPKESDYTTIKIVQNLKEDLSFTEEEHELLKFYNTEDGMVHWNSENDIPKEIPIGEKATDIIASSLRNINATKKLREDHISLYEKFYSAVNAIL